MLRNIAVYLSLALSMMTIVADEAYPVLEFIKDGKVIETREMTAIEYDAYIKLKTLEVKLEKLEKPLQEFQADIEIEAEMIEAEARLLAEETLAALAETGSLSELSRLSALGDMGLDKLDVMLEEMQPMIDEITEQAEEISATALNFKDTLMVNFDESDFDQIRIIDGEEKNVIIGRTKSTIDLELDIN